MVLVEADVGGVAAALQRIDQGLKLRYSEGGQYWCVEYESKDGREHYLILTAQECDHRIVHRLHEIDGHGRSGYDYVKELESASVERKQKAIERFRNHIAEHGAEAQHALRRDLGIKNKIFVPRSV